MIHVSLRAFPEDRRSYFIGYFTSWSLYRTDAINDVLIDKLTHINYAFLKISSFGQCIFENRSKSNKSVQNFESNASQDSYFNMSLNHLLFLKKRHPHLKIVASVGGWNDSFQFSEIALTQASRERFVESCLKIVKEFHLDGIEIDWEYPVEGGLPKNVRRPSDKSNYILLLKEFRRQMKMFDFEDSILAISIPAPGFYLPNFDIEQIHPLLTWLNLMAYDFATEGSAVTNHHAPLYDSPGDIGQIERISLYSSVESSIRWLKRRGIPSKKIVLGIPFYGRGWGGVSKKHRGLYQRHEGPEKEIYPFYQLMNSGLIKCCRFWDKKASAAWIYDPSRKKMISYEDPRASAEKARFAIKEGLRGIAVWELKYDDEDNQLVNSIWRELKESEKE